MTFGLWSRVRLTWFLFSTAFFSGDVMKRVAAVFACHLFADQETEWPPAWNTR